MVSCEGMAENRNGPKIALEAVSPVLFTLGL